MKDYRKIIFVLVVSVFALQMFVFKDDSRANEEVKPIVSLSTFSLYDISEHISQGTFELVMILPVGVDAHSYEPTPKIMAKIDKSELVVYSGAGLEPWTNGFDFKSRVVDMSKFVRLREIQSDEYDIHQHHDEQCAHNKIDPHYWLDIDNMIKATNLLTAEFIRIKPKNKELYSKNRDSYLSMLNRLDALYKKELSSCYLDTIVVNHNAFSYLSTKYGFNIGALSGFSSDYEITPKDMIRVINIVNEHKVQTVFFESFVSDKAIKSLANEVKVGIDTLQPLSNVTKNEYKNGLTYEEIMKINLVKISKALICK